MGLGNGGFRLKIWPCLVSTFDFWGYMLDFHLWISSWATFLTLTKAQCLQHTHKPYSDRSPDVPFGLENPDFANDRA